VADVGAVVDATQRLAGVLAAWHRGDADGAAALMNSFADDRALAGGALLLADLALRLYSDQSGQSMQDCVQELSAHLDLARRAS
jgi:hypothetical protein